eukprot:TRINITY_DN23185_c0_g2_i1.p1 TRINITY_DN23185_c0_g2~~TRINITY_DN23185_c0_g2_i1.p1  ORF type:complete len:417 (+),score=92.36 TRINITY_DN23185_c0_g2_i1:117-1367(+)
MSSRRLPKILGHRRRRQDDSSQIPEVLQQLKIEWEFRGIPSWHQELYTERYCTGRYRADVLQRELKALRKGKAVVQQVQSAITQREEVLARLTILRTAYSDEDFSKAGSMCRKHLYEQLYALRKATVLIVEVMSNWRLFVAPSPGQLTVAGPGSRGACWPYAGPLTGEIADLSEGIIGEDYLLHLARDDMVIKSFHGCLEVSEECDPFLLHRSVGGIGPNESGKLCPPPTDAFLSGRLEAARMKLLEEELSLTVFDPFAGHSLNASQEHSPPTRLLQMLSAPLELPMLQQAEPRAARSAASHGVPQAEEEEFWSWAEDRRGAIVFDDASELHATLHALLPQPLQRQPGHQERPKPDNIGPKPSVPRFKSSPRKGVSSSKHLVDRVIIQGDPDVKGEEERPDDPLMGIKSAFSALNW